MHNDVAIIIPARLGSERLEKKPLQMIGDKTMIEHMLDCVKKTNLSNVFVATDSEAIAEKVTAAGGKFIMTEPACPSGTDRVFEAFARVPNNNMIDYIVNVQGDMPFVKPETILGVVKHIKNTNLPIVTPVAKVSREIAEGNSNVKVVVDLAGKALYFSRSLIPYFAETYLYHVGIYAFRRDSLKKFVNLPQSELERLEKLEQLRALQNGIDIGICYVDDVPISIDTPDDLAKALEYYKSR